MCLFARLVECLTDVTLIIGILLFIDEMEDFYNSLSKKGKRK